MQPGGVDLCDQQVQEIGAMQNADGADAARDVVGWYRKQDASRSAAQAALESGNALRFDIAAETKEVERTQCVCRNADAGADFAKFRACS